MADKKVDEGWKAQVRKEKAKLATQPATGDLMDPAEAESIFLGLVQTLFMQLKRANHPQDLEKLALTLQALYQKTKGNLSSKEQMVFQQITAAIQPIVSPGGEPTVAPEEDNVGITQAPPTPFS